jgi:hypothetical protein
MFVAILALFLIIGWSSLGGHFVRARSSQRGPIVLQCGGSRSGTCTWERLWLPAGSGRTTVSTVRGSFYSEVTMHERGQATAVWLTGSMFGEIEGLGRIRLRLGDQPSLVAIRSLDITNPRFFPAVATQSLFYKLEVLDLRGSVTRTLVNKEAMNMTATIQSIPPYGTDFSVDHDVVFEDVNKPGVPVITLKGRGSKGSVSNPGGLQVEPWKWTVDADNRHFEILFRIANTTGKPMTIHWFAGGVHNARLSSSSQGFNVRLDKGLTISLSGSFDRRERGGAVVLHATSVPGQQPAEGHYAFYLQQSSSNPSSLEPGSGR